MFVKRRNNGLEVLPTITLPKFRNAGVRVAVGATPVPVTVTILVPASVVSEMVPVNGPAAMGEKSTVR